MKLIAKRGPSAAIMSAGAVGLLVGCALAWLVFSTHLSAQYPQASLVPIAAVLTVYIVIVAFTLDRGGVPLALPLSFAIGPWSSKVSTRALEGSVRPRLQSGDRARPLNFTVR